MNDQKRFKVKKTTLLLTVGLMSTEWVLLVAGLKKDEMIVGLLAVVLAASFLWVILHSQRIEYNFTMRDVCALWRVPWYIVSNTYTLCAVLFTDVFSSQPAGSFYRVSGFKTSKTDPTLIARRVLATAYTTVSPNSIVIGIDYEQSRLLLHQVKRDEISKMTKELGGQP